VAPHTATPLLAWCSRVGVSLWLCAWTGFHKPERLTARLARDSTRVEWHATHPIHCTGLHAPHMHIEYDSHQIKAETGCTLGQWSKEIRMPAHLMQHSLVQAGGSLKMKFLLRVAIQCAHSHPAIAAIACRWFAGGEVSLMAKGTTCSSHDGSLKLAGPPTVDSGVDRNGPFNRTILAWQCE
jgi:hypothetical protein